MQIWSAREREKSFASGLWETADSVMCLGDGGGGVCVCVWKSDSESEGEREMGEKEGVGGFR
jgi:hypothetical protein